MPEVGTHEAARTASQKRRVATVLALNLVMIVGLVAVGLTAHSLSVLAAGGDFVADSAALALGLVAISIRERVGPHSQATTIVAGINAVVLTAVTLVVAGEAIRRLVEGTPHITPLPVLIVSLVAAVLMGCGALVLGGSSGSEDLHMRSVLLDTVADAVAATAVAATGALILVTDDLYWVDSVVALGLSAVVGFVAIGLIKDVIRALRSGEAVVVRDDD